MKHYIGNINSLIECDKIIAECLTHEVTPDHNHIPLPKNNPYYTESINQSNLLKTIGYDDSTVEYRHYKSKQHFNASIEVKFGEFVNATPLMCWVSEVRPGKCVPWHWDINPWEYEQKQLGNLIRYFCFLSKPQPGHVFVTVDDAYYMEQQGAVYQYADLHAYHAGANVGIAPKFLLTFTGYQ